MDTNRVALKIIEEKENGKIPENPNFIELRNTGTPGFGVNPTTITSNEIRPDRQVADITTVGAEPGGEVEGELSFGAYDMLFEGAFQKRWVKTAEVLGSKITDITSNAINMSEAAPETIKVGSILSLSGFKLNSGNIVVSEVSGNTITVTSGLNNESSIPSDAKIKVVGFEAPESDVNAAIKTESTPDCLISTIGGLDKIGLQEGMWIKIGDADIEASSFATKDNNAFARVGSVEDKKIYFSYSPKGFAADDGSSKKIRIYFGDFLKNADKEIDPTQSVEIISYSIEQSFLDHKPIDYQYVSYAIPDTLSLSMSSADFITMSTSFLAATTNVTTTRVTGAKDVASAQNPVMNTSSNIAQIARGNAKIEGANYVNELTMEINNNGRRRTAVGVYGAWSVGLGEFAVTGSMQTYFSNAELYKDLIDNKETSLNFVTKDNNKHAYFFDMPRVKYSGGNPEVSGKNEDVMLPLDYQAIRDPELGYTLSITKFEYVN